LRVLFILAIAAMAGVKDEACCAVPNSSVIAVRAYTGQRAPVAD
jgi:hypothetical protein